MYIAYFSIVIFLPNLSSYLLVSHIQGYADTLREEILADRKSDVIWRNLIWRITKKFNFGGNLIWRITQKFNFGVNLFWLIESNIFPEVS